MPPRSSFTRDGLLHEFFPLLKNGFVILRSLLDILIEMMEETEAKREADIRRDIYESMIEELETEIETARNGDDDHTAETTVEALEQMVSVLLRRLEELDSVEEPRRRRPQKVNIE